MSFNIRLIIDKNEKYKKMENWRKKLIIKGVVLALIPMILIYIANNKWLYIFGTIIFGFVWLYLLIKIFKTKRTKDK